MAHQEPIPDALRARLDEWGPAAIERFDAFGRADRRESALALVLAGAAPALGLLFLRWEPAAVVVSLLLNLLLRVFDDLLRILRARGELAELVSARDQDQTVWTLARAMLHGRDTLQANQLRELQMIEEGRSPLALGFAVFMALVLCGLALPLTYGAGASLGSGQMVVLGTAPSVVLSLVFAGLHHASAHRGWRQAGSVRLQSAAVLAFFVAALGSLVLLCAATPHNPPVSERQLAEVATFATMLFGLLRFFQLHQLGLLRRRLGQRFERHRRHLAAVAQAPDQRPNARLTQR